MRRDYVAFAGCRCDTEVSQRIKSRAGRVRIAERTDSNENPASFPRERQRGREGERASAIS